MVYSRLIVFVIILFCTVSCVKEKEQRKSGVEKDLNYSEDNYYKVQGIIVKSDLSFSYTKKFRRDYTYIYYLERDNPLKGIEKISDLIFDIEDPVAIMVNKKDSTDSFIGHRGIIDEEVLVNYLTREDNHYESMFDEKYLEGNYK